jgi:hypothetical protein
MVVVQVRGQASPFLPAIPPQDWESAKTSATRAKPRAVSV